MDAETTQAILKAKAGRIIFYEVEKKAKQQVIDEQLQLDMKMSRLGGKVIELKKIYKSYGDKILLKGFDYEKRGTGWGNW